MQLLGISLYLPPPHRDNDVKGDQSSTGNGATLLLCSRDAFLRKDPALAQAICLVLELQLLSIRAMSQLKATCVK